MRKLAKIKFDTLIYVIDLSEVKFIHLYSVTYGNPHITIQLHETEEPLLIYCVTSQVNELEATFNDLYTKWESWTKSQNEQDERLGSPYVLE